MDKKRIIVNFPVENIKKLKSWSKDFTYDDEVFTMSGIIESCVKDLINENIKPKEKRNIELKRHEFHITDETYYNLLAESARTGYTMTEIINMAYEKYNPDVNEMWDLLR